MFGLGLPELLIIFFILLLLFGARRLKDAGAGLGGGLRAFKDALTDSSETKPGETPAEKKQIP